jgi:prepilin-type N-terminal cleavage/methylation domain-containing protein
MSHGMKSCKSNRGVTLIELLIAVTLVGMLSLGLLFAMRVGLDAMQKSNARLLSNRRVMSVQRILEEQVANIMPVTASCRPQQDAAAVMPITFFQGEPQSMRFVSSYSLQEGMRGYPRILELQVIPIGQDPGVRLIVNEYLYSGPLSTGAFCLGIVPGPEGPSPVFAPVTIGPGSFVLVDKLAFCRFLYRSPERPPAQALWFPRWLKPLLPNAVRIEMAPLEPASSKLEPVTVTIPVRVNREPMSQYAN